MSDALSHIREKLKRADEHIQQLDRELKPFLHEKPRTLVYDDLETRKAFEELHRNRVVPARVSVLTGWP